MGEVGQDGVGKPSELKNADQNLKKRDQKWSRQARPNGHLEGIMSPPGGLGFELARRAQSQLRGATFSLLILIGGTPGGLDFGLAWRARGPPATPS